MSILKAVGMVTLTLLLLFATMFLGYIFLVAVMLGIDFLGWVLFILFIIADIAAWTCWLMLFNNYL